MKKLKHFSAVPRLLRCPSTGRKRPSGRNRRKFPDEGESWQVSELPGGGALGFVDAYNGWLLASGPESTGSSLYRTEDGGESWTKIAALEWNTTPPLEPLNFVDGQNGWAATVGAVDGALARTTDGASLLVRASTGVQIIHLQSMEEGAFIQAPQMVFVAALSPDGQFVAADLATGLYLWSVADGHA